MGEDHVIVRLADQLKADGYHSAAAYLLNLAGEDGDGGLMKSIETFFKASPGDVPNLAYPELDFEVVGLRIGTDESGGTTMSGKLRIGLKPGAWGDIANGILSVGLPAAIMSLKE